VPVSYAESRRTDQGWRGAIVSMVSKSAVESLLRFPAPSIATALMLFTPSARAEVVIDQVPVAPVGGAPEAIVPDVVPVPTAVIVPFRVAYRVTELPASAVPVIVGVLSFVMLSEVDRPALSLVTTKSRLVGATVAVSIVIDSAVEVELTLPAASVAIAVNEWIPVESVEDVIDHVSVPPAAPAALVPSVTAVPRIVEPSVS